MTDHYYTVAEVAELTGLTKQAIYKRLDKDLAKYLSPARGKKLLHEAAISALRDVSDAPTSKVGISTEIPSHSKQIPSIPISKVENSTEIQPEISTESPVSTDKVDFSTVFQQEKVEKFEAELKFQPTKPTFQVDFISFLKEENARLNAVIAEKDSVIAEKDAVIADYAEKFAAIAALEQELTERSMAIASQAQTLHLLAAADDATKRTWREKLAAFILGKNKK